MSTLEKRAEKGEKGEIAVPSESVFSLFSLLLPTQPHTSFFTPAPLPIPFPKVTLSHTFPPPHSHFFHLLFFFLSAFLTLLLRICFCFHFCFWLRFGIFITPSPFFGSDLLCFLKPKWEFFGTSAINSQPPPWTPTPGRRRWRTSLARRWSARRPYS